MKRNFWLAITVLSAGMAGAATSQAIKTWSHDNQFAAGEWKIEVQTPPCDSAHNIQVIYPKESGAPIAIECDLMPVATR